MILKIKELKIRVGDFLVELEHLEVPAGTLCCVMGPSGSGKSTLLSGIAGFTECESGKISYDDKPLERFPPEKRRMAFVFQRSALFPHLDIQKNVEFGLRLQGVSATERATRAKEWLARLEIGELASRYPHQVSEGQAQRAAIARALITGFPVCLLDEPFSALDAPTRDRLRKQLKDLVKEAGVSAILVTHDPEDAKALADQLVEFEAGRSISVAVPV